MKTVFDILTAVRDTLDSRGKTNGYDKAQERSAKAVATLFTAKTGKALTEADVWQVLVCLKEVRLRQQIANAADYTDTLVDLVSYNALLAECLEAQAAPAAPWSIQTENGAVFAGNVAVVGETAATAAILTRPDEVPKERTPPIGRQSRLHGYAKPVPLPVEGDVSDGEPEPL